MPGIEIAPRGFVQSNLGSFKQLYELLGKHMTIPNLTEEPEIIEFPDRTFALSWWPHQLYSMDTGEVIDREVHARGSGREHHQSYLDGELLQRKEFEQQIKDFFNKEQLAREKEQEE